MRYAIISDVHANLEALTAVLQAADEAEVHQIVCLGDLVGYYADPNGVVELIRQRGIRCVRGNHDSVAAGLREPVDFSETARRSIQWTGENLTDGNRRYLASLPLVQSIEEDFVVVHAALHPEPNDEVRIRSEADAKLSLQMLVSRYRHQRVCFFGHTHHPVVYTMQEGTVTQSSGQKLQMTDDASYLINPGSVGQSRAADPRASMVVYDALTRTAQFHRVSYDCSAARAKAMSMGLIPRPHLLRRSARWIKGCLRATPEATGEP